MGWPGRGRRETRMRSSRALVRVIGNVALGSALVGASEGRLARMQSRPAPGRDDRRDSDVAIALANSATADQEKQSSARATAGGCSCALAAAAQLVVGVQAVAASRNERRSMILAVAATERRPQPSGSEFCVRSIFSGHPAGTPASTCAGSARLRSGVGAGPAGRRRRAGRRHLERVENAVLLVSLDRLVPGTGKTHISIALGVRACLAGQRVLFGPLTGELVARQRPGFLYIRALTQRA